MRNSFVSKWKTNGLSLRLHTLLLLFALSSIGGSSVFAAKSKKKDKVVTTFTFKGKVVDENKKGIEGVVVNDGYTFVKTASDGSWSLLTDTLRSKFVSITTPAEYSLPQADGLATGYYASVSTLTKKKSYTFSLTKRASVSDNFRFIAISDPQINNAHDMGRWKQETVPDLKKTIAEVSGTTEVIAQTLGDLVFDKMPLYPEYKESCTNTGATFFQCIGNHDFDKRFKALSNTPKDSANYGEHEFNRYFGPTDYSYNVGKIHIITIKNIDYAGDKHYTERLTNDQLEWLKNDLSFVPKGSTVFLNMHAAGWNKVNGGGNVRNAAALELVLRGYKVHVFAGHTHFYQNIIVNDELYQHNIGASCGAWWASNFNRCGAPNGFLVVDVNGTDVRWHYKGTGEAKDFQLRVYSKGSFPAQTDYIVANVWDYDEDCSVVWYQDDKPMGRMERIIGVDEAYAQTIKKREKAPSTIHLFRAIPDEGKHTIKVEFTNQFGEKYTQTINE